MTRGKLQVLGKTDNDSMEGVAISTQKFLRRVGSKGKRD